MSAYKRILFPLDFSETAPLVAGHAAIMASRFQAELHLLHVVPGYEHHAFASYEKVMHEIKQDSLAQMESFAARHLSGIKTLNHVASGHTGRGILSYARDHDISLIIMGTHGRSGLGQLVFGSVAQRVVQSSKVPVMTVNPSGLS
jgi:nucleotide-binding universal stress UspA family protein